MIYEFNNLYLKINKALHLSDKYFQFNGTRSKFVKLITN